MIRIDFDPPVKLMTPTDSTPSRLLVPRSLLALSALCVALVASLGCFQTESASRAEQATDLEAVLAWRAADLGATEPEIERQVASALERLQQAAKAGAADDVLAERLGEVGMLHQLYQSKQRALEALDLASGFEPSEPRWPYYRALMLHESGDLDDAVAALERCLATGTEVLAPRVRLAETLMSRGDVEAAAARFEELRAEHPESLRVAVGWAESRLELGDTVAARRELEELHRRQPDRRRIQLALGRARRAAGDLEGARPLLQKVNSLAPADRRLDLFDQWVQELAALDRSSEAAWSQGRALLAQQLPEAALTKLRTALERQPDRPAYWTDLGTAQSQLGRSIEAEASYRKALDLDPEYLPALAQLGMLQQTAGHLRKAISTFDRLLSLDPERAAIRLLKGEAHRLLGEYPRAIEEFERVLKTNPGDERTLLGLFATHVQRGDDRAAVEAVRQGLEARPASFWFRSFYLRFCALGLWPDSSCRAEPEQADLLFEARSTAFAAETMAMALAAQGQFDVALRWQQAAVEGLDAASASTELARRRIAAYRSGDLGFPAFEPTEFGTASARCRRPT